MLAVVTNSGGCLGYALGKGILAEGEKKGNESIELFFKSLGFKRVVIEKNNSRVLLGEFSR
jgi:hypothetical protein